MHRDRVADAHCLLQSSARRLLDHRGTRVSWHGFIRADGAVSLRGLLHRTALGRTRGQPEQLADDTISTNGTGDQFLRSRPRRRTLRRQPQWIRVSRDGTLAYHTPSLWAPIAASAPVWSVRF